MDEVWGIRDEGWEMRDEGWGMRAAGGGMRKEGWGVRGDEEEERDEGWGVSEEFLREEGLESIGEDHRRGYTEYAKYITVFYCTV